MDNATIVGMFKKDFTEIKNPRISKLFEDISHFNVKLQHTSGKENVISDTLSRTTKKNEDDIPDVDAPEPGETVRRVTRSTRQSEKIRDFLGYTPRDITIIAEQGKECPRYQRIIEELESKKKMSEIKKDSPSRELKSEWGNATVKFLEDGDKIV